MLKRMVLPAVVLAVLVGVAAIGVGAQSQAPAPGQSASSEPALGGYCPVAYVAMDQAMTGSPQHRSVHEGKTYLLANAEAKKMFDAAPAKYTPAYDGWCATAVAQGMKMASDPTLFTVHEGRAYLFSSPDAKKMFDADKAGTVTKANANWPKVSKQPAH